ncbi:MAG: tetratricopeptide repeat protein [Blastocatellia bacterium]|nr:tetratricopeptide repeat protein [Blastocatellia bacterium]
MKKKRFGWFWLGLLVGLVSSVETSGQTAPPPVQALQVGKPVMQELKGGETHRFRQTLAQGTFLDVVVETKDIDVALRLTGPDGTVLVEVDASGNALPEELVHLSQQTGEYLLEIRAKESGVRLGQFTAKLVAERLAKPEDREAVLAQKAIIEGKKFRQQASAEGNAKALEFYQVAREQWKKAGNQLQEAMVLVWMANIWSDTGDHRKSLDLNQQALPLFRTVGNGQGEADTLQNLGVAFSNLGDPKKALEHYTDALRLYREIGDKRSEADTLTNLAIAYGRTGDNKKAVEVHQQALVFAKALADGELEARNLTGLGSSYRILGETGKALECYQQALPLRRKAGDRNGEAYTLSNLGVVYETRGEGQKALEVTTEALRLFREVGNRSGENAALINLGKVYSMLGAYPKALEHYGKAREVAHSLGDRQVEAIALNNMGFIANKLNQPDKALEYYNQSLPLRRAVGDRKGEATVLNNMGTIYVDLKDMTKARETLLQAMTLRRELGDKGGAASTLHNLGTIFSDAGEPQKGLEYYLQALALRREIGDRAAESRTLTSLAQTYTQLENYTEARNYIEQSLKQIEFVRASVSSKELRASYLAIVHYAYELYIDILMRMHSQNPTAGYDKEAMLVSEQARARSLLELLTESGTNVRQGADPALLEQEQKLYRQISSQFQDLSQLLVRKHTDEQEAIAKRQIETTTEAYREVQNQIRRISPRYAALTQPRQLTVPEIQQQLDADVILLEFTLGRFDSFLFAVTKDSFQVFFLPKQEEIETLCRQVYDHLTARNRLVEAGLAGGVNVTESDREYWKVAAELSNRILGPVSTRLAGKRLLIVADGFLQYIPIGALPLPLPSKKAAGGTLQETALRGVPGSAPEPLLVYHEVCSLPSVSALAVLRAEKQERKKPNKLLAVLADPVFGGNDDERVRGLSAKGTVPDANLLAQNHQETVQRLIVLKKSDAGSGPENRGLLSIRRLPGTRTEAESLIALSGPADSLKALDFEASRTLALSDELGQYRYVHFATHGLLDAENPELSALVLTLINRDGQPQDGFLRVFDLYNLNLPADLVTLSACKTGLGKDIKGEGIVGMTRGFMYAGASRVAVSLWNIEDKSAALLMKGFYQGMLGPQKLRPAAALRAAQLELWRQKRWQAPYYWAGFIIQGEPN